MVTITQIQTGLTKFIDNEMVGRMSGIQKWIFGAGAGIAVSKAGEVFDQIRSNPIVKTLGIVNDDGEVDIDLLQAELSKQAKKTGAVSVDIPMLGAFTFKESDIEKLGEYIKNA